MSTAVIGPGYEITYNVSVLHDDTRNVRSRFPEILVAISSIRTTNYCSSVHVFIPAARPPNIELVRSMLFTLPYSGHEPLKKEKVI